MVDTPEFQRLRRVKQLGFAHLVYPGAVHTRFLHALGVYHLTRRALETLRRDGGLEPLSGSEREEVPLLPLAALLHDVGHYAFSHAMEEVEPDSLPGHHEELAGRFLRAESIHAALTDVHPEAPERIGRLIRGSSGHPLQGLIAGSLDLDKIDYLRRDSLFCGVPYGNVDVDRLMDALAVARAPGGDGFELAVKEKGISALESLLFSKYQMFRNVYWHHTVRAATSAFRRLVESAVQAGLLAREELPGRTDDELMSLLGYRVEGEGREVGG
ncbi:MAG: HD domain-containing protein, partial [Gemmatimonadota bacterium]